MKVWREAPRDVRSHVGDGWFERSGMVGTADERNRYLFHRRVVLQLKIGQVPEGRCSICKRPFPPPPGHAVCGHEDARLEYEVSDVIIDVRCYTENDETGERSCLALSVIAANALIGKTIPQAVAMTDDDFLSGVDIPWQRGCNGRPLLYPDAVRAALLDWSLKATGRKERLPFVLPPPAMPDASILTPFGRFLRALGL